MSGVATLTIEQVQAGLASRQFSARELAQSALDFAQAENPKTNAYLHFCPERALAAAERVDQKLAGGENAGPLAGVPIAVKDVIVTKGVRTTCGSRLLERYIPPYDATAVRRLEQAGAVILRKNQLRRVRHGVFERKLRVRTGAQSGGARSRARWIERRFGRGRGAGNRRRGARLRHRRIGSTAGLVLRRGRRHAHLRPRLTLRTGGLRQFARSHRAICANGARRGAVARNHRRPRRMRCHIRLRARAATTPRNWMAKWQAPELGLPREYFEGLSSETGDPHPVRRRDAAESLAAKSARSACPPPNTRCRAITSSPRPRPAPIWRATTACATPRVAECRHAQRHVSRHARRGFRRRVQAPHHAGHLRAEPWLLRRILFEGAESARADRPGFSQSFCRGGRDCCAGFAVARV